MRGAGFPTGPRVRLERRLGFRARQQCGREHPFLEQCQYATRCARLPQILADCPLASAKVDRCRRGKADLRYVGLSSPTAVWAKSFDPGAMPVRDALRASAADIGYLPA